MSETYLMIAAIWVTQCICFYVGKKSGEIKERKAWNELMDKGIIPKPRTGGEWKDIEVFPTALENRTVEGASSKVLRNKTKSKASKTAQGRALSQPMRRGR